MDLTQFKPPEHLSERAKGLWSAIVPEHARSAGRLAMVQTALEALDRADQASEVIAAEGMVTTTKRSGVSHLHPLLKVEKESRQLFGKLWSSMGLGFCRDDRVDLEHYLKRLESESGSRKGRNAR